jgi:hypothetical protein
MIGNIVHAFPLLRDRCLESDNRNHFFINDPGGDSPVQIVRTIVSEEEEESLVKVINENEKQIYHISIDKCLVKKGEQKSCDSALLDDVKIVFLELKLNTTSTRQKSADDTREGGLFQIAKTIELFQNELSKNAHSLESVEVIAQVATSPISPRSDATYKLIKSAFAEKYGYDFFDSREVVFI